MEEHLGMKDGQTDAVRSIWGGEEQEADHMELLLLSRVAQADLASSHEIEQIPANI